MPLSSRSNNTGAAATAVTTTNKRTKTVTSQATKKATAAAEKKIAAAAALVAKNKKKNAIVSASDDEEDEEVDEEEASEDEEEEEKTEEKKQEADETVEEEEEKNKNTSATSSTENEEPIAAVVTTAKAKAAASAPTKPKNKKPTKAEERKAAAEEKKAVVAAQLLNATHESSVNGGSAVAPSAATAIEKGDPLNSTAITGKGNSITSTSNLQALQNMSTIQPSSKKDNATLGVDESTNDTVSMMSDTRATATTTINGTLLPEFLDADAGHVNRGTCEPGFCLAVGENLSNQLGLGGNVEDRKKPQLVKELPTQGEIIQVAAGGMHSACLTKAGSVYTWGCNDEYALGRNGTDDDIQLVDLPEKCVIVTAGDSHTAALAESGVVYAWGTFRDGSGVLGLEKKKIAKTPMKFKLNKKVVKISSGTDHLVFLTSTGEVYSAGNSEHGQLGRVSKYNSSRGGRRGCDMILEPALVRIGKRKELQGHKQIEDIWTTSYCTFLKVKDSDLFIGFGLNNCYQLGLEDTENQPNRYQPELLTMRFGADIKIKKIIGGMHHTLILDTAGGVYAMGSHRYGALGLGKIESDVIAPQKLEKFPKDEADLVVDIAANTNVSYAITKRGKVYNWGTNYSKQLGQDTEDDYDVPTICLSKQLNMRDAYAVSIGGQHSLVIVSDENEMDSDESM